MKQNKIREINQGVKVDTTRIVQAPGRLNSKIPTLTSSKHMFKIRELNISTETVS